MTFPIHETILRDVAHKSGEYPAALEDAVELLVQEQHDLIPIYMYGGTHSFGARINALERKVETAERRSEAEGRIERIRMRNAIDDFRGKVERMIVGMTEWDTVFIYGVLWSDDILSSESAISKPEDPRFSFRFKPKTFDLGLTGRLLKDANGTTFAENLRLECDIYDAYHLALDLKPKRIVAVDSKGKQTVVYEDYKEVGEVTKIQRPSNEVNYFFSQDQIERWWTLEHAQVLPTNGLSVAFSDFWEQVKKYDGRAMLFGHQYPNINEFLSMATLFNNHFIWRYCTTDRSENTPLIDCELAWGLRNQVREMPENKNRLLFMPNKAILYFGRVSLYFDKAVGVQALTSLGDMVRDIWFDPVDRDSTLGWDIVYDRARGITPNKVVPVNTIEEMARYPVLKSPHGCQLKRLQ